MPESDLTHWNTYDNLKEEIEADGSGFRLRLYSCDTAKSPDKQNFTESEEFNKWVNENITFEKDPDGTEYAQGPLGLRLYKFGTGRIPALIRIPYSPLASYIDQLGDA